MLMNQRTYHQVASVILIHCLQACNEAKLPKKKYIKTLQNMLDARGVKVDAGKLIEELMLI